MGEAVRRRNYRYNRILIGTDRVLDPQFDDAVVFLTGAQIEMLRNVTQYLNRLETYVSEYTPGYYLTPTAADYDDILEIVADLEETLMGNPNTLWGYNERYVERADESASGAGDVWVSLTEIPSGEVWVVENFYMYHDAGAAKGVLAYVAGDSEYFYFIDVPALSPGIKQQWQGKLVLEEGDRVWGRCTAPGDGKTLFIAAWGYKMAVPE